LLFHLWPRENPFNWFIFLFSLFSCVTPVVTGRRVTASPNEGIDAGAKVAIFSQLFVTASTFRVDALVRQFFIQFFHKYVHRQALL